MCGFWCPWAIQPCTVFIRPQSYTLTEVSEAMPSGPVSDPTAAVRKYLPNREFSVASGFLRLRAKSNNSLRLQLQDSCESNQIGRLAQRYFKRLQDLICFFFSPQSYTLAEVSGAMPPGSVSDTPSSGSLILSEPGIYRSYRTSGSVRLFTSQSEAKQLPASPTAWFVRVEPDWPACSETLYTPAGPDRSSVEPFIICHYDIAWQGWSNRGDI